MDAIGIGENDHRRRIACLMSLSGPECREVHGHFEFATEAAKKNYAEVIKKSSQSIVNPK